MVQHKGTIRFSLITIFLMTLFLLIPPVYGEETKPQEIPPDVQEQLDVHINRYINEYVKENCELEPGSTCVGSEYKKARRFRIGDLDGDGMDDIVAFYAIEGLCCGNSGYSYIAVFTRRGSKFALVTFAEVGGSGERDVEINGIKNGKILLNTGEYLPDDPMCCPSGKGSTIYTLKNGKLIESDRVGEMPISPVERFRRASERTKPLVEEYFKKKDGQ